MNRLLNRRWLHGLVCAAFGLYLLAVITLTLLPVPSIQHRSPALHILARVNLVPFNFGGLFELHPNVIRRELGGNILLTVPYGLLLPVLARVDRRRLDQRRLPWLALAPGLAIELAQLTISLVIGGGYRGVDINDVMLNTTGALVGFGLSWGILWSIRRTFKLGANDNNQGSRPPLCARDQ